MLDEQTPPNEQRAVAPPSGVGGLIYYYHPDHLGTSTALTDYFGNAYQFFLNLPFGETMAQQLGSNYYNSPYKFNGKELDEETGFYYYGARYYDPRISIFQSVDPLVEQTMDAYGYCYQNPINLIDPTGMSPEEGIDPPYKGGIQIFQAADTKGDVPYGFSRASEAFKVGDYDVLPNYVTDDKGNEVFSHYTTSVMVNDGQGGEIARIDYILGKGDLSNFKKEIDNFEGAANLLFGSRTELSKGTIDILNNSGYGTYIKEQMTNPINWIVAIKGIALTPRLDASGGKIIKVPNSPYLTIQKGNKTYHISPQRVKEYIKNPKNPNSRWGDAVDFKKYGVPEGSSVIKGAGKGHKRTPTPNELRMYNKYIKQ